MSRRVCRKQTKPSRGWLQSAGGRRYSAALAVGCGFLLRPCPATAIIDADNPTSSTPQNTSQPDGLTQWNNVGAVNSASGIYVGNGWVLTADHVGAGNINLDGTTYDWNGQSELRLINPNGSGPADLVMFQLTFLPAGLSNLTIASSSPAFGTSFYNVGYGLGRNTAEEYFNYDSNSQTFTQTGDTTAPYQGFGYGGSHTKSWGQNTVQGTASYNISFGNVNAFYASFDSSSDQLINGDSGGSAFDDAGTLIGVNDAIAEYSNQPSNTVLFGDQSYMIDISPFYSQITDMINGRNWAAIGGGNWATAANWNAGGVPATGATAYFSNTIILPSTINLNGAISVGAMVFNSANSYTIAAGSGVTLTLSNGGGTANISDYAGNHFITAPVVLGSNTQVLVANAGDTLQIPGNISGGGALSMIGTGTLLLGGSNSYSGGTSITGGTLLANANNALPSGANLANNSNVIVNATNTVGNVSGSGAMTVTSGGNLTANGFTQASLANAGTVNFNGTTATVSGNVSGIGTLGVSSATTFTASGSFNQAALANNGTANLYGSGTIGTGGVTGSGTLNIGAGPSNSNVVTLAKGSVQGTQTAINLATGSMLDITNNSIVLTPTAGTQATALANYLSLAKQGYNGGSWTGTGITSSAVASANKTNPIYAIAVAEDDGSYGTVVNLGAGQIEVAEAVIGDATLSGSVNYEDFALVEANYGMTGADWDEGDFFYTGTVDYEDLAAVEGNYGHTNAISASEMAAMQSFAGNFGDALVANPDGVGFQMVALPEPTSGVMLLAGLLPVLHRRRRKR